jgi:DNA-directed RNA polymerase specialized sigma subunit
MTAKEYLMQAINLDKYIQAKRYRIAMLKDRATRVTGMISVFKVKDTKIHSPLEDSVCKYVDLQAELANDIERFYDLQREISEVIEKVGNNDRRALLEYRYLSMCSWDEIAKLMMYSSRHVTRIHAEALKAVKDVLACPAKSVV